MKNISKTCEICNLTFEYIPNLRCGHFVCNKCYCKLKSNRANQCSNKCGCPTCGENMIRKCRI
jgi:hypothetical protein